MKRFLAFCLIVLCLSSVNNYRLVVDDDILINDITYIFWTSEYVEDYDCVFNGLTYEYQMDYKNANNFKYNDCILGQGCILFSPPINFVENYIWQKGIRIISQREINDTLIINGYSSCFDRFVVDHDRYVNVQIAVCGDYVKIGTPLILGSI